MSSKHWEDPDVVFTAPLGSVLLDRLAAVSLVTLAGLNSLLFASDLFLSVLLLSGMFRPGLPIQPVFFDVGPRYPVCTSFVFPRFSHFFLFLELRLFLVVDRSCCSVMLHPKCLASRAHKCSCVLNTHSHVIIQLLHEFNKDSRGCAVAQSFLCCKAYYPGPSLWVNLWLTSSLTPGLSHGLSHLSSFLDASALTWYKYSEINMFWCWFPVSSLPVWLCHALCYLNCRVSPCGVTTALIRELKFTSHSCDTAFQRR